MIGILPKSLIVEGKEYPIRSDYRVALAIFEYFNDVQTGIYEKILTCIQCLYIEVPDNLQKAYNQAVWFLDGGQTEKNTALQTKRLIDWKQDEQMIFSAINKIAGHEIRQDDYLHWWTFLGFFNEIGEGLFSTVINIRQKKNEGKKLENYEQEFYRKHKDLITLKQHYTPEEQAEINRINNIFK